MLLVISLHQHSPVRCIILSYKISRQHVCCNTGHSGRLSIFWFGLLRYTRTWYHHALYISALFVPKSVLMDLTKCRCTTLQIDYVSALACGVQPFLHYNNYIDYILL